MNETAIEIGEVKPKIRSYEELSFSEQVLAQLAVLEDVTPTTLLSTYTGRPPEEIQTCLAEQGYNPLTRGEALAIQLQVEQKRKRGKSEKIRQELLSMSPKEQQLPYSRPDDTDNPPYYGVLNPEGLLKSLNVDPESVKHVISTIMLERLGLNET